VSGRDALEKLTAMMTEDQAKAARLGYALGYVHGDTGCSEHLPWPASPEWRVIEDMGLVDPKTW
jgi:hypothetical protein